MTNDHTYADLVGAYVLHALPADEQRAFEAHLSECPTCRRETAQLGEVVGLLANNGGPAPGELWKRIAAAGPPGAASQLILVRGSASQRRAFTSRRVWFVLLAAAVLVTALTGVALWT